MNVKRNIRGSPFPPPSARATHDQYAATGFDLRNGLFIIIPNPLMSVLIILSVTVADAIQTKR